MYTTVAQFEAQYRRDTAEGRARRHRLIRLLAK